jgi:hypothetical protein
LKIVPNDIPSKETCGDKSKVIHQEFDIQIHQRIDKDFLAN